VSEFIVQYERKISDQNYGSEGLAMSWSWTDDTDPEGPGEALEAATLFLKKQVLTLLGQSRSRAVRSAAQFELEERKTAAVVGGDDDPDLPF
jgi:hypothetical protein